MMALELQELVSSVCMYPRFLSPRCTPVVSHLLPHLLPYLIFFLKVPAGMSSWRHFPNSKFSFFQSNCWILIIQWIFLLCCSGYRSKKVPAFILALVLFTLFAHFLDLPFSYPHSFSFLLFCFLFFPPPVESCRERTIAGYHTGFFMTDKKGNSIWWKEKLGIASRSSWEAERMGRGEESASLYFRPALLLTHHCQSCDLWLGSPTPVVSAVSRITFYWQRTGVQYKKNTFNLFFKASFFYRIIMFLSLMNFLASQRHQSISILAQRGSIQSTNSILTKLI